MNQQEIKERIQRNENALDELTKNVSIDFWHRERLQLFHSKRIFTLRNRLYPKESQEVKHE